MKLNHVGFAVTDLDEAVRTYERLGFSVHRKFEKPEPRAYVASMKDANGGGLELWQFTEEHPLRQYIGRHAAFLSDDVRKDAAVLINLGFTEVIPFTEGIILDYIFVSDQYGTVFELAQEKKYSPESA